MANTKDATKENIGDIVKASPYDAETLRNLDSFEAAMALTAETLGAVPVAADEEIGDGFALLTEDGKSQLIGVPLIFMEWTFNAGDFGEFVSARVAAKTGGGLGRFILNDGSTGVYAQLREFTDRTGKIGGLVARRGLRRSDYMYDEVDPRTNEVTPRPAHTYYIDTSA